MRNLRKRSFFSIAVLAVGLVCGLIYETMLAVDDKYQVIRKVSTTHKVVALTIDDGPHPQATPEVLKVLRDKQVKATFFVLGANAQVHPGITAQTLADGHEIASHAYSHQFLNRMSLTAAAAELEQSEAILTGIGAPKPTLFRPPGGGYNDRIVAMARERGYTTVLWSVDSGDWRQLPVEQVVKTIMDNVRPGSIILMHDGQYPLPTPQAIGIVIDNLRSQDYQFVTVSELLQYYEAVKPASTLRYLTLGTTARIVSSSASGHE